jgi:phage terminase Nu1 subunit (DNA packaging protein)
LRFTVTVAGEKMGKKAPNHANLAQLANIFGVHRQTVRAWVRRGCPFIHDADQTNGRDWLFDTAAVAAWRVDRAVEDAVGGTQDASEAELRRRKLAAETVVAELAAAKARGELGSIDEFEDQVRNAAIEIRTRLMQMVARVAPMVVGLDSQRKVKDILEKDIRESLEAISDELGRD